jgi:hypothetical protein
MDEATSNEGSATTEGNALPNRDPPDVTRIKPTGAKSGAGTPLAEALGAAVSDGSG